MENESNLTALNSIHKDLQFAINFIYNKCGFEITHIKAEQESAKYGAFTFRSDGMSIKYRVAKTTPTKTGQFVTIWKRNEDGLIVPFDISDDLDLIIISTRNGKNCGQFIFPKYVLFEKGIISGNDKEGKRGIRVYPPWDKTLNKQAQKTQQWQLEYFLEISNENLIDLSRAIKLFNRQ